MMASWKSRLHTMLLPTPKRGVGFEKGSPKSVVQNIDSVAKVILSKKYSNHKIALIGEPLYANALTIKSTKITQIFEYNCAPW